MKQLTLIMALMIVIGSFMYCSMIIGTLFHELTHAHHAQQLKYINVNYDGSGETAALAFDEADSERYAYFNGNIVMSCILLLQVLSLFVIMRYKNE